MSSIDPSALKVAELRTELTNRNLPTKGKKDELIARLKEAIEMENNNNNNNEQVIEKPSEEIIEQPQAEVTEKLEEQVVKKAAEQLVEKLEEEIVEKTQEQVIEKSKEEVIEKSKEEVIEKPAEEVIEKPTEKIVEQPAEVIIEKPAEVIIEKPAEEIIEKPTEEVIEMSKEEVIAKPKEDVFEKPKEEIVKKPNEESEPKETINIERNAKRRRPSETTDNQEEKRPKVDTGNTEVKGDKVESSALYVKGFVRPLIIRHVQELFGKYGKVKRFWMDSIKTHCYVIYETGNEAKEAYEKVNGVVFPEDTGKVLTVDGLTPEQAEQLIEYEQFAAERRLKVDWEASIQKIKAGGSLPSSPASDNIRKARSIGMGQIAKQLAQAAEPTATSRQVIIEVERKPKESSLDDLFRKTEALPHLYYLPVSDEEAKIKLNQIQNAL